MRGPLLFSPLGLGVSNLGTVNRVEPYIYIYIYNGGQNYKNIYKKMLNL